MSNCAVVPGWGIAAQFFGKELQRNAVRQARINLCFWRRRQKGKDGAAREWRNVRQLLPLKSAAVEQSIARRRAGITW